MEPNAVTELRCPTCLGRLRLEPFAVEQEAGAEYVRDGVLLCESCRVLYPVASHTPVLLRFHTPFHDWFARTHSSTLRLFASYSAPSKQPRTGELSIQDTFTDEWNLTRDHELAGYFTEDQLEKLNRSCWLRYIAMLPEDDRPRTLLNVGCGAGMETLAVRKVTGAERTFAVDLNYALLQRREAFRRVPGINFVIASLFDPPFAPNSFDLAYSVGVLHHTYSTHQAFEAISSRVCSGGYLFVWVYGLDDHLTPWGRRSRRYYFVERAIRPWVSRAPRRVQDLIFKLISPFAHLQIGGADARRGWNLNEDRWGRANTEHAIRDWLSPRYAWRHGFNEVSEWFEDDGYIIVDIQSSREFRRLFDRPLSGVGIIGRKAERSEPERQDVAEPGRSLPAA